MSGVRILILSFGMPRGTSLAAALWAAERDLKTPTTGFMVLSLSGRVLIGALGGVGNNQVFAAREVRRWAIMAAALANGSQQRHQGMARRAAMDYAAAQYGATAAGNPFAVLTAVVAPAILTNACSVLALGTSNRLARELALMEPGGDHRNLPGHLPGDYASWAAQLAALQVRTQLLVKALRVIYGSLGWLATAALVSVVGSIVTYYGQRWLFQVTAGLALLTGAVAVVGLASGCALMVHETRLAVQSLADEAKILEGLRM